MAATRPTRLILTLCLLAGFGHWLLFPRLNPEQIGIATDVYHHATASFLDGGSFYGVEPPDHPGFSFLYPPVVGIAAIPFGLAGSELGAYILGWILNIGVCLGLGQVFIETLRQADVAIDWVDQLLLRAIPFLAVPAVTTLVLGQVNLLLSLGIGLTALAVESDRERRAGVIAGLVALVKLFPALIGVWFLRLRAWRAVGAAFGTGIGALLGGVVLLGPGPLETWATTVIAGELSVGAFPTGPDPASPYTGLRRQLVAIVPGVPRDWLLPLALMVVMPAVLANYRRVETLTDRLIALEATVLASLLVVPLEPFYTAVALFPTVPLVYLVEDRWPKWLILGGVLLILIPVNWGSAQGVLETVPGLGWLLDPVRSMFAVVRPSDIGTWAILVGGGLFQHRAHDRS